MVRRTAVALDLEGGARVGVSLESVFERSFAPLVRTLTIAAGDRQRAEDAVQDAFTQAYLHWPKVQHYGDPSAWLRRVATNRILNQHRSVLRRRTAVEALEAVPGSGVTVAPDTGVTARVDLAGAARRLPLQQRTAVALFNYADLPVSEVADAMGLFDGTVRFHLHAARQALKLALEVDP